MKDGWYILNYHDVSWEENIFMKGIGGTFSPDIFQDHLACLADHTKLISIQEGFSKYLSGEVNEPLVSIWFDDGFLGVRKYAYPILQDYDLKAAISVNSEFALKQQMFWRAKLSYIYHRGMPHLLRSKLRRLGYNNDLPLKRFVLDHFSAEIIEMIDDIYNKFAPDHIKSDSFRLFDDFTGISKLHRNGWEIANHSASHYPVAESTYVHKLVEEFEKCEVSIKKHLGINTRFWVIPFDRKRDENLTAIFKSGDQLNRTLVLVGNQVNREVVNEGRLLHRIIPGLIKGQEVVKKLKQMGA